MWNVREPYIVLHLGMGGATVLKVGDKFASVVTKKCGWPPLFDEYNLGPVQLQIIDI